MIYLCTRLEFINDLWSFIPYFHFQPCMAYCHTIVVVTLLFWIAIKPGLLYPIALDLTSLYPIVQWTQCLFESSFPSSPQSNPLKVFLKSLTWGNHLSSEAHNSPLVNYTQNPCLVFCHTEVDLRPMSGEHPYHDVTVTVTFDLMCTCLVFN